MRRMCPRPKPHVTFLLVERKVCNVHRARTTEDRVWKPLDGSGVGDDRLRVTKSVTHFRSATL